MTAHFDNALRASEGRPALQTGLRLQIVLALAGLMVLAFVPLFFAVASLTRATFLDADERSALSRSDAIAARIAASQASGGGAGPIERMLRERAVDREIEAACYFPRDGSTETCAGLRADVESIRAPSPDAGPSARRIHETNGRPRLEVVAPSEAGILVSRIPLDDVERAAALVRLLALYMIIFALALLVLAYSALTRLIVRPVDQLVSAADRVASGARTLLVPRSGARELVELGASVKAMAGELIAEEAALLLKVEELTETTARLQQAQSQLVRSERMASVGRLAAGLAHEIGNPLAALMGMHDLLLDGGLPEETQRDFLQRMRRETERIRTVVRDLLDFARPEQTAQGSNAVGGSPAIASVDAVVDDVLSLIEPQRSFRDVRIERALHAPARVAFSPSALTQVMLNLLLNAGDAIASAGRPGRVVIRAQAVNGEANVRIEVEDDGPGVDPAVRDRLFEPFVTTKDVGEGTGLGLAVCRGLVESVGGQIALDVSHAEGARFYVVLPAASA